MHEPISANQLRWLGEHADGLRGDTYVIRWVNDELILIPAAGANPRDDDILVHTDFGGGGGLQQSAGRVTLAFDNRPIVLEDADAAFWTQSAVEKFVLPYYTRVLTPNQIGALKVKLFVKDAVVALHSPPSITKAVLKPRIKVCVRDEVTGEVTVSPFKEEDERVL